MQDGTPKAVATASARRMTGLDFGIVAGAPEQFAAFQRQELARRKAVIGTGKITVN